MSTDLSDGVFAEVSTGGTEDTFDGGSNFSVSMWVKGKASDQNQTLISKQDIFSPSDISSVQLWLDASELSTAGSSWSDKSGNGNDASKVGSPSILEDHQNGQSVMYYNANGQRHIWTEIDDIRTVFWVISIDSAYSSSGYRYLLSDTAEHPDFHNNDDGKLYGSHTDANVRNGSTWLNGTSVNGTNTNQPTSLAIISLKTTGNVVADSFGYDRGISNRQWIGKLGELIIFDSNLTNSDIQKVETYLAHKWGLTGSLPSSHPGRTTPLASWSITQGALESNEITLNFDGAGGKFTQYAPTNDDKWHHITTTFGGGNKKIYLDGEQVGTASQTGTVTASNHKLILGQMNSGTNMPKISDVRFYRGVLSAAEVAAIYNNGSGDIGQPKLTITSPSSFSGSTNKSISYQASSETAYGVTGHDSTVSYELLNVPSELSLNMSGNTTGTVTGTASTLGTYNFQVKASSTSNDHNWSAVKDITLNVTDYSDWNYAISFGTDYSGSSAIKDWNMLVRLSEDSTNGPGSAGFRYSQANSNGGDLRFINKYGEELKYEIANWNTSGESQVWVRVPSLRNDSNITMYWGNSNAGLPSYATDGSTWDDYFGVYHLEQISGSAKDSTSLGNDLSALNTPVREGGGMSGASYKTSSSSGFSSNAISGGDRSAKEGTYSIWAKHTNGYSSTNRQIGLGYKKKNTSTQGSRKTGWRTSRISGDSDSGISSSYLYTTAVNFGSNQTVNGVAFTGVGNV